MTLTEKLASLASEQLEKLNAVKDVAALDAFASECGIELTGEEREQALEYFQKGILPLDDDDLDTVAGGAAKAISPQLAVNDGRYYFLPEGNNLCVCNHQNKWARTCDKYPSYNFYQDIKCYKCGKMWAKYYEIF